MRSSGDLGDDLTAGVESDVLEVTGRSGHATAWFQCEPGSIWATVALGSRSARGSPRGVPQTARRVVSVTVSASAGDAATTSPAGQQR